MYFDLRKNPIRGSMVALITPFDKDDNPDIEKLKKLLDWHVDKGTDGIVLLGTTSETPTLTPEEDALIAKEAVAHLNGRIPMIIGAGSNDTAYSLGAAKRFEAAGADALLCITPYYNKGNKNGIVQHFKAVADNLSIPIILYNVPGRTGVSLDYEMVKKLSQHYNIIGVKEASGNISLVSQLGRLVSDSFSLYSGNDDMIVPLLSCGGTGVISVLANILPTETHDMVMAYLNGDQKKSTKMQLEMLDYINALFIEVNPIPIKEAMNYAGITVGGYRLPLSPMEEDNREKLHKVQDDLFAKLGIKDIGF